MNNERDHDGLRDETVSRAYRHGATDEPPPALDALILAAARREVALRSARRVPWWLRALAPVGILATIVLTVSLTLMVEREQRDLLPAPMPAAAPVPASEADQAKLLARPAAKPVAPAESKAKNDQERPAQALAPAASAPAFQEVTPVPPPAAEPELFSQRRQSGAPATAAAPPVMLQKAAPEAKSIEGASTPVEAAGGLQERSRAVMSAPRREVRTADKAVRTPEDWIEDIRRLKREGREPEAKSQLALFRLVYPEYRLPEDLKKL